ncbi:hypothetical protein GDO81_019764 [Engystomops pustulosus]|uniref:Uncharacterized protein n=1 Tax=Engystomops pustulosus TaxID=76066 RepID=A0AAV6YYH3_ENGPU|nr:hypothetical protein GDO81_019764 [Engystomops pustulosus]
MHSAAIHEDRAPDILHVSLPRSGQPVHLLLPGVRNCIVLRHNLNLKSRAQSESFGSSDCCPPPRFLPHESQCQCQNPMSHDTIPR